MQRIGVSENKRFLVNEDGSPFFWLADTAWELFHRLTLEEAELYLENRRQRGFSVIQAVALAEFDGLGAVNAYGELPLIDMDPTRPNERYFQHVDAVVKMAEEKGLVIGMLPTWGDKVLVLWGGGPVIFDAQNARVYGEYLGKRYRDAANVIWILGGDRPGDGLVELWTAMAEGLDKGAGSHKLTTLHPCGGRGSSEWFHACPWLDMNMWQSGHSLLDAPIWEMIGQDLQKRPLKPVVDAEPNYEDHPIDPFSRTWKPEYGRFNDYDVRKQSYRSVFAGGCGVTYGHHTIWQFYKPPREPINYPVFFWDEAIYRPGAAQLVHLKNLMLSRPYLNRMPDQGLLLSYPGEAGSRVQATRDLEGSYAFVYIPQAGQTVSLDLGRFAGPLTACWYDPRTGHSFQIGDFPNQGKQDFVSPLGGPDWVLVLDESARRYPPPGRCCDR
jgi:hypothetical protein